MQQLTATKAQLKKASKGVKIEVFLCYEAEMLCYVEKENFFENTPDNVLITYCIRENGDIFVISVK